MSGLGGAEPSNETKNTGNKASNHANQNVIGTVNIQSDGMWVTPHGMSQALMEK